VGTTLKALLASALIYCLTSMIKVWNAEA